MVTRWPPRLPHAQLEHLTITKASLNLAENRLLAGFHHGGPYRIRTRCQYYRATIGNDMRRQNQS